MIKQFKVVSDQDNMRIDRWLRKNNYNIPQGLIEKFLRTGKIKINGKKVKSSYKVLTNDIIKIFSINIISDSSKIKYVPSKKIIKYNERGVIFNSDDYIIINKSSGISVQGGTKSKTNLVDIFAKSKLFKDAKPYTVHRIDKETSGLLIIGKNRKTAQLFTSLFRLRKIYKSYIALCNGEIEKKNGIWEHSLQKKEKTKIIYEKAITKFKVIDKNLNFTLLEMNPITGRKHQLRKQSALEGYSIYGDTKYGFKNIGNKKLFLHAYSIKFKINGKNYNYYAPLPEYFKNYLIKKKFKLPNFF